MMLLRSLVAALVLHLSGPAIGNAIEPVADNLDSVPFKFSRWLYDIDHVRGYTGIINREQDKFYLYDSLVHLVLVLQPTVATKLFLVEIPRDGGALLLGESLGEGTGYFTLIGYDGKAISKRLLCKGGLRVSPGGRFLYSLQGEYAGAPTVYDRQGHVLMESRTSNPWMLSAANDSEFVFVNGQSVQVYSVPAMTQIRGASFPNVDFGSAWPPGAAIADENAIQFAFMSDLGVVICDLLTASVQTMPRPQDAGDFRLAWAGDGHSLLLLGVGEVPVISVFEKGVAGYSVVESKFEVKLDTPVQAVAREPIFFGHVCAVNYFFTTERGAEYRSYVFRWDSNGIRRDAAYMVGGLVTRIDRLDPLSLTVLRLNNPTSGTMVLESWSPED